MFLRSSTIQIFVVDTPSRSVKVIDKDTGRVWRTRCRKFYREVPCGVAVLNDHIFVSTTIGNVFVYDENGKFLRKWNAFENKRGCGQCTLRTIGESILAGHFAHYKNPTLRYFDTHGKLLNEWKLGIPTATMHSRPRFGDANECNVFIFVDDTVRLFSHAGELTQTHSFDFDIMTMSTASGNMYLCDNKSNIHVVPIGD